MPRGENKLGSSLGGLRGWAKLDTDGRAARIAVPHRNSPSSMAWHARKLGYDPDHLTAAQAARVETAYKLYFAELSEKARQARQGRHARHAGGGET